MSKLLIRGARQLISLWGPGGPRRGLALSHLNLIERGAILIENGVVIQVGLGSRVENLRAAEGAEELNAAGRLVMPAMIDSCARVWGSGYPQLTPADARSLDRLWRAWVRHGITLAEVQAPMPEPGTNRSWRAIRGCPGPNDRPLGIMYTLWSGEPANLPFMPEDVAYKHRDRVLFAGRQLPVSGWWSWDPGASLPVPVKVICEPVPDSSDAAEYGLRAGAASVDGPAFIDEDLIHRFAHNPVLLTVFPTRAFRHPKTAPPVREWIDAGAPVAIASGYEPGVSPNYSPWMNIEFAVHCLGLSIEEAIAAHTINAAYALRAGTVTGSIEFGKQANIILLNLDDYRELDRLSGVNPVVGVIRHGEILSWES